MRRVTAFACVLLLVAAVSASAQAPANPASPEASAKPDSKPAPPDTYTGTTANMAVGAGSPWSLNVMKWSSDADREKIVAALNSPAAKNPDDLGKTLAALPATGYIWTSAPVGYSVKYAQRIADADGGERVIVLTDRLMGTFELPEWKVANPPVDAPKAYTVVELRLNKAGKGDGKMSLTAPVTVDVQGKALSLANSDTAVALLTNVSRKPKT